MVYCSYTTISLNMAENTQNMVVEWACMEHVEHERGRLWHVLMPLFGVGLLIYAVITANFLFAFIIILFSVLIYLRGITPAERIACRVSPDGLIVGPREIRMRDIRRFWFAYEPPVIKCMYVEVEGLMGGRLCIHLEDADPNDIRAVLGAYVQEDLEKEGEPFTDVLARILKI